MENRYVIKAGCFLVVLVGLNTQAAIFTLTYLGTNVANVSVSGLTYAVGSGNSIRVDTGGVAHIPNIAWTEVLVIGKDGSVKPGNSFDSDKDSLVENDFIVDFPKPIDALNLGGTFTISENGKYSYYFGIDTGWESVTGTAKQTAANRHGGW